MRTKIPRYFRILALTMIFSLLLLLGPADAPGAETVEADEPITVVTVITVVAGVTAIVTGAVWLFDRFFGPDEGDKVCTTTKTTTKWPDGTIQFKEVTKYSKSLEIIVVPDDVPGLGNVPPSYTMSETTSFDARLDERAEIKYIGLNYHADVTDPAFAPGRAVEYAVERTSTFRFLRPPGALSNESSIIGIPIEVNGLVLATTDLPGTKASSSYEWIIESPELGVIFKSNVHVPQGGIPVVSGDIPTSAFTLQPGRAELSGFSDMITLSVPPEMSEVNFAVIFNIFGEAELLGVGGPTSFIASGTSPWAGSLPVLAGWGWSGLRHTRYGWLVR